MSFRQAFRESRLHPPKPFPAGALQSSETSQDSGARDERARKRGKELAEDPTFNCWHETDILDFLVGKEFWDGRDDDGNGIIHVSVQTLEELLKEYKWDEDNDDVRDAIAADIAWAKANDREHVEYDCF